MKVLLVQSPRYYWPYVGEGDNHLMPQWMPCLAASIRQAGHSVRAVDCMASHIGWRSLADIIREEKPHVIGVGENHCLYAQEAIKVFQLAKSIDPGIKTIAGGVHFTNLVEPNLMAYPIDYIAIGEGEKTFVELLDELERQNPRPDKVTGLAYRTNGHVSRTAPRVLEHDLDTYPLPAYDLMPMEQYGKSKYLFAPGGTTAQHSRGCVSRCNFCVWWVQNADRKIINGEEKLFPRWRTKSVGRTVEEIEILSRRYGKNFLVFVDDAWNIDCHWTDKFANEMARRHLPTQWFAFMRADCMMRDERLGLNEKLVHAGMTHISIGVERHQDTDLAEMRKGFYKDDLTRECFGMLKRNHPTVFRQGTFIVGIRDETRESMYQQLQYAKELGLDYPGFHPLTPVPGTEVWEDAKARGWIEVDDFSYYDWMTPIMSSTHLSRREIEEILIDISRKFVGLRWLMRGLADRHAYRRNMYVWWLLVSLRIAADALRQKLNPFRKSVYTALVKPTWYDH
ncbi:MAG: cobalamin B12-binding domain-containing protein [Nitrospirae bacterium]|nr:cobalamin B12-binding domain-containing protein [Nitrospirota bacterium]